MTFSTFSSVDWLASVKVRLQVGDGQTMAEYAVVLGVISFIVFAAFTALSTGIQGAITSALTAL